MMTAMANERGLWGRFFVSVVFVLYLLSFIDTKVNTQATLDLPVCARHVIHPVYHR